MQALSEPLPLENMIYSNTNAIRLLLREQKIQMMVFMIWSVCRTLIWICQHSMEVLTKSTLTRSAFLSPEMLY